MRLKLTLFLVLLNIALFSYIVYLETGENREADEAQSRLILPAGTVAQAEELSVGGARVDFPWTVRREGSRWQVTQPVEWTANPYAIRRLFDLLSFLRWETRFPTASLIDSGKELADYGLDEGAAELRITGPNETLRLRVGAPTEIGNRVYVLSPDRAEIYVVDRSLLRGVRLESDSLIDQSVIGIPAFEAESLNLSIGSSNTVRVQLSRENGDWALNAPVRAPADPQKVNAALDSLHRIQVGTFTDLSPAGTGISDPELRLNLNGNNRQQTILLGDVVDAHAFPVERYAKLEARSVIFTVPAEPFEVWFKAQESLRQRRFMNFSPPAAGTLEVRMNDRSITLQKLESGRWQLVQTIDGNLTTRRADDRLLEGLLQHLVALEAVRFVSDAPSSSDLERYGFTDPQRTLTVRLNDGSQRTLLLGNFVPQEAGDPQPNRLYAKLQDAPSVYLTTASILADFPVNALHYRERVAGSLPSGAVLQAVRIVDLDSEEVRLQADRTLETQWEQVLGELPEEEQAAARALIDAFRRFPVERFVAADFSDPLILGPERTIPWKFAIEAEVIRPGRENSEPEVLRYYLSERLGGATQYAGSSAHGLTFVLPRELIDALHPVLFNRPPPSPEAASGPDEETDDTPPANPSPGTEG